MRWATYYPHTISEETEAQAGPGTCQGHRAPLSSPAIGRSKHTHSHSIGGWGSWGGTHELHQGATVHMVGMALAKSSHLFWGEGLG